MKNIEKRKMSIWFEEYSKNLKAASGKQNMKHQFRQKVL